MMAQPMMRQMPMQTQRWVGSVLEWNPERACGFLECPGAPGAKFFAHKSEFASPIDEANPPIPGARVDFVLGIDPKSGKERAKDIRFLSESGGYDSGRCAGTLEEWKPEKACGFIICSTAPYDGKRIFAHKSEFAEPFEDGGQPELGTPMTFVMGLDSKSGRERAQDIRVGDEADVTGPTRLYGMIASWSEQKGCGFIEDGAGKKWFAHKTEFAVELGEGAPVGIAVSFIKGIDKKSGKERAQDIAIEDGQGAPQGGPQGGPLKRARLN